MQELGSIAKSALESVCVVEPERPVRGVIVSVQHLPHGDKPPVLCVSRCTRLASSILHLISHSSSEGFDEAISSCDGPVVLIASHNLLVVEVIAVLSDELKGSIIVTDEPGDSVVDKGLEKDKVFVSFSCSLCLLREEPGFARSGINKNKNIVVAFVVSVIEYRL